MDEDENLCKVETKDGEFYLFTKRLGKDMVAFNLHITDGSSIWKAKGKKGTSSPKHVLLKTLSCTYLCC